MDMDTKQDWQTRLELVHRAAIAVAGSHDVESALQTVADSACAVIGAEMAAIGVPGEPGQSMAHFVVSGLSPEVVARAGRPPMGRGVLGILLKEGRPLRVDEVSRHPAFRGFPAGHPYIRSFLGVPVQGRGEVIGDLYLANKLGGETFTEQDQQLAEMLASHAAVVIQTLRFHRKNEEVAAIHARAQMALKIQDDVLQTLYGVGLLLSTLDLGNAEQAAAQILDVQDRLDQAIEHLRQHLLEMAF